MVREENELDARINQASNSRSSVHLGFRAKSENKHPRLRKINPPHNVEGGIRSPGNSARRGSRQCSALGGVAAFCCSRKAGSRLASFREAMARLL